MQKTFTDHIGKELIVPFPPKRIVSVVPSQTELLHYLKLDAEVVGITKFCEHPASWHQEKTRVGGTKNLNIPLIQSLAPDLILANKEENVKDQIEALEQICAVWTSDIKTLFDALHMIEQVGIMTDRIAIASKLCASIQERFNALNAAAASIPAAYLIWKDPYMTVGSDTFISHMMQYAGLKNIFESSVRYPEINIEALRNQCSVVLLSSEPYLFREKHIKEITDTLPGVRVILADGSMFSWYGSRLLAAADYFADFRKMLAVD